MGTSPITIEELRTRFIYKPTTGAFLHRRTGKVAGWINDDGYRVVKVQIDGRRVQIAVHKAAYAIYHGRYPDFEVDHRNTKRADNRIKNLREATRTQNMINRRRLGKLPKGVARTRSKSKPYKAQITLDGRNLHLGTFSCPKLAHAAFLSKSVEVYGEFARAR